MTGKNRIMIYGPKNDGTYVQTTAREQRGVRIRLTGARTSVESMSHFLGRLDRQTRVVN